MMKFPAPPHDREIDLVRRPLRRVPRAPRGSRATYHLLMSKRGDWFLAGAAVAALAALLDIVFMTADQTMCQTPGRSGCPLLPLWAYVAPWLLVALGLMFSAVVAYLRRRERD